MLRRAARLASDPGEALLGVLAPRSLAGAQARGLAETGHRPWPLPEGPWLQGQTWCDLLFAHWPVPAERLRAVVPPEVPLDTFAGSAWVGVTPFVVRGLRLRGTVPVPRLSCFAEVNVRTYTTVGDRPGIHFLSLDAASLLAVAGARLAYGLPYFHARMSVARTRADGVVYRSRRDGGEAALAVDYGPTGPAQAPQPSTLEHFLTERYCLYTVDGRRRVHRGEIHHPPWPLQPARAHVERNTLLAVQGIDVDGEAPVLHFAARQDVVIWAPRPVARDERRG